MYRNINAAFELAWLDRLPSLHCQTCLLASFDVQQLRFPEQIIYFSQLTQLHVGNSGRGAQTSFMADWAKLVILDSKFGLWTKLAWQVAWNHGRIHHVSEVSRVDIAQIC